MKAMATACFCALLISPPSLKAATVYRCVDSAGHTTFTRQGCPTDQALAVQDARNPTPSTKRMTPLAEPGSIRNPPANRTVVVVGERDDGCGNQVTGQARRNAIISGKVQQGMTQTDVESALGKPDGITRRNGQVQYRYLNERGSRQTVSFDERGCVRK